MIIQKQREIVGQLAERLAPGRKVTDITIRIRPDSVVVADVGVLVEEADLPLVVELTEKAKVRLTEKER